MLEKGKISAFQMGMMGYPLILGTAILAVPAFIGKQAERDMWISPFYASIMGFLTVYLAARLNRKFPDKTIIQYGEEILGKIGGKVLGFFYLLFILHLGGQVLREYAEFTVGVFLPKTPLIVVIASMALLCAFAVRGGIEVLGRLAQLYVPLFILPLLVMVILLLKDLNPKNMFPIMRHGVMPSLLGAATPQAWFSELFLLSFLFPALTDKGKGEKWGFIATLAILITFVVINLVALFLFGEATTTYLFPVFSAARYISIANFFEHLESVVMAIWVSGIFIKMNVFYYSLSLGTAQWLNLSDYRPVVVPLGLLLTLFGMWTSPNFQELISYFETIFPFYTLLFLVIIPSILLLISAFQRDNRTKGGTNPSE
jgi:spore germination protein KB